MGGKTEERKRLPGGAEETARRDGQRSGIWLPLSCKKGEGELERGLSIVDVLHLSGIELLDEGIEFQALTMLEDEA